MGKHSIPKNKKEKSIKFNIKLPEKNVHEDDADLAVPNKTRDKKLVNSIFSMLISVLILIVIPFCPLEAWMIKAAYGIALLISGLEIIWAVLDNVQNKEYFASENICLLSSALAFCIGEDFASVLILVLFRTADMLLDFAKKKATDKLKGLAHIVSDTVTVETSEGLLQVSPDYVNIGEIILVAPGEMIALDGIIVEGISTIDTSEVSGQSNPWAVNEGHRVYSGCRNITSQLKVRVTKSYEQSTARRLVKIAESSVKYPSRQEKFCSSLCRYYAAGLLAAAIVLFVCISLINGDWLNNGGRAVVLLTAATSAIALQVVPIIYMNTICSAAERGVFSKGSDCIEALAKAQTFVFDKTGIVTEGRYIITDVFPNKVTERELFTMAATAERFSRHPIAAALRDAVGPIDIDYKALQIEEIPGRGVSAFVAEKQVYVGNAALLEEHGIKCAIPSRSGAAIHVAVDYKYWGHILITDRIRRGAFDALENLRANGVKKMVLLTGDVLSVAKPLASKLNFDMLRAELKPSDKLSAVEFLMANRGDTTALAFIGDGNSDEQIMARVDVGVSLGSMGHDSAFASADILVMDRDIKKLPAILRLSKLCYKISTENILAWLLVNSLMVILGAIGVLPVLFTVIANFILVCASLLNTIRIK